MKNNRYHKLMPFQSFSAVMGTDEIVVSFEALCRAKSQFGTIYYSKLKPTVTVDGNRKIVGFSRHAIERILTRSLYGQNTLVEMDEICKLLNLNTHYEVVTVAGKQLLSFYDYGSDYPSESGEFENVVSKIAKHILKKSYDINECYYYRVGYLPIGVSNEFATGITLLLPGMKGTPEYELLRSTPNYNSKKDAIASQLSNTPGILNQINDENNLISLEWFHDNGIPQVVTFAESPFRY